MVDKRSDVTSVIALHGLLNQMFADIFVENNRHSILNASKLIKLSTIRVSQMRHYRGIIFSKCDSASKKAN